MNKNYLLNPFASVIEMDDGYLLCAANRLSVRLTKEQRPLVDILLRRQPLSSEDLGHYLSEASIDAMRSKHILIDDEHVPPVDGRYSRQLGFFSLQTDNFEAYQSNLRNAHVLLLGAGAIGSHILWHLAAMGVNTITVLDHDIVEETNLNRQLLYTPQDIGRRKVEVLCGRIGQFNPEITVHAVNQKVSSGADIEKWLSGISLVIKAIDTPEESTEWVNEVCVKNRIPFIGGGFVDDVGVVGPIYLPGQSLCTACMGLGAGKRIHGNSPTFAPLTGIVSSLIAMCAFRVIVGRTESIVDKLFTYDVFSDRWEKVSLSCTRACQVCGRQPQEPLVQPRRVAAIWWYRGAIVFLTALAAILRSLSHDPYIGLAMVTTLLFSMPVLEGVCKNDPVETRRQMLIISCIYCLPAMLSVGLDIRWKALGASGGAVAGFDTLFGGIVQASFLVMQTSIGITGLFFALNAFMYALKAVTKQTSWIS